MEYTARFMSCGCEIKLTDANYQLTRIIFCPKHKAAPDMYKALKNISPWSVTSRKGNMPNMDNAINAVRQALAKAEGK